MTSSGVERDEAAGAASLSVLAAAAQCGGRRELGQLLEKVRLVAHRYSRARLATYPGGLQLADDTAQEICIAVMDRLPSYVDTGRPFEAFVHGIASRKVADAQRKVYRAPVPVDEVFESAEPADHEPTPEEHAVDASDASAVRALLAELPDHLREVLVLRIVSGLSTDEVGAALDMSAGAVRVAQHRALTKLRAMVAEREEVGRV